MQERRGENNSLHAVNDITEAIYHKFWLFNIALDGHLKCQTDSHSLFKNRGNATFICISHKQDIGSYPKAKGKIEWKSQLFMQSSQLRVNQKIVPLFQIFFAWN